jgi:signal transduction histidine kinase
MTTISGFVDGILDGTIPPEEHEKYLQIISAEVHRLSRLENTLLEISRLESGKGMNTSEFNLTETARQILISLMGKIEAKKLDIAFESGEDDEDVFVLADPDAIHQVMYNLVDNAIKFTQEGGTVSIGISAKSKKALVRVRNTGEGIPEEEISHIFERFYKSDRSRGLDKTGTGLGLYIVKTILEKHGEEISVESVVGAYTEFHFGLHLYTGKSKSKGGDLID